MKILADFQICISVPLKGDIFKNLQETRHVQTVKL